MSEEIGGGSRPNPDPSDRTIDAAEQAIQIARDYTDGKNAVIEERLRGIDRATELLSAEVNRVPSKLSQAVDNLDKVFTEKFDSVALQFKERDIRAEREARDNKVAVDAAFAAQKEAAAKQDEANAKAIDKSEKATAETIKTNQESTKIITDSLTKSLYEAKQSITRLESSKQNTAENKIENRANTGAIVGYIVGAFGMFSTLVTMIIFFTQSPP